MPVVSVIMPIYNAKAHLMRAVLSVLAQTVDLELIAVDDCSTDGSDKLLSALAASDNRIKAYYNSENRGVGAVRNFALAMAKGEYLAFCDADDFVPSGAYERLLRTVGSSDIAIGAYRDLWQDRLSSPITVKPRERKSPFTALLSVGCLWTKLFSRSFVTKNRLSFDEGARIGEDVIFLAECAAREPRCSVTDTVVYHHVHASSGHPASLTHTYTFPAFVLHVRCRERILLICDERQRRYVYRHFTPFLSDFISSMPKGKDRAAAFELFKKHLFKFDFYKFPELFFAVVGVSIDGFESISDTEFVEKKRSVLPREKVLIEFSAGTIGLSWIIRYFLSWLKFKFTRKDDRRC